ncbi:MAG: hypothetical protein A2V77_22140 [Anaeromyxobacter sp. RBG_16_69_14]|nr:MAG: hypothetical protein A2V77_22140 [Anaeromyxobacter sp. RBG_16_69_14]
MTSAQWRGPAADEPSHSGCNVSRALFTLGPAALVPLLLLLALFFAAGVHARDFLFVPVLGIATVSLVGGVVPGLVAVAVSVLGYGYLLSVTQDQFQAVRLMGLTLVSLVVALAVGSLRRAHQRVEAERAAAQDLAVRLVRERAETERAEETKQLSELRYRQEERRFRRIVETAQEGIWMLDDRGRSTYINQRMSEMFGVAADNVVGVPAEEFVSPDHQAELQGRIESSAGERSADRFACQLLRRGEGAFWGSVAMNRMGSGGEAPGSDQAILLMVTDVTDQRRLQEQFLVSDRMASIGLLAAGVAHEVNNPLSAVLAALEAAVGTPPASGAAAGTEPTPDVREGLGDALSAARRMRTIVSDLRVFSRVEEPNGLVDVETVLESMLRMAWSEIRHRAHVVRAYQSVPKVKGNESRLGQVFLNLIMNAAQAIDEGSADRNEIGVAIRLDPRQRVLVEIRDTGCGMPPEVVRHIFTPFFTTKPSSTGTGLGLSICQRIVDAMGGEITAENAHGRGSVFRVHLPTAAGEPSLRTGPAAPASAPAPRRGHVLVIDDEAMVARAASRILARDHDVTVATGARAGLEHLARGEPFDVILCDLMMPEVSGIDLHAEICRSYPERRASLIFMSGGVFSTKARSFVSEHPEAVVVEKPFDAARLQALVQAGLGGDGRG